MKKLPILATFLLFLLPFAARAGTVIVEGDEAKTLYSADKGKVQVLVQKNRGFVLRSPAGVETKAPPTMTVKAGERFYIINDEDTFVHNVYDLTDSSWVLRKQLPSNVAAVTFESPGKHDLRCAIHPTMEIEVDVK